MKRLVLYSDQIPGKSDKVDKKLIEMLDKDNSRIAYIPSCADVTRKYFNQKIEYYGRLGIHDLMYFDIDMEYKPALLDKLLACDAIHLSGGDTGYFLSSIRRRGFIEILRNYALNGGMLIGVSAGSIMMSESIDVVALLHEQEDELCCTQALNLVGFEFVPHWDRNQVSLNELKQYSKQRDTKIYCCNDSDGIVVNNDRISFVGSVVEIENGNVNSLQVKYKGESV